MLQITITSLELQARRMSTHFISFAILHDSLRWIARGALTIQENITVSPPFMLLILLAIGFKYVKMAAVHFHILSYMHRYHSVVHADGIRLANKILKSKAKLLSVFPY
jgi:hypothetical protein